MDLQIKSFFLFIILVLLQSCSGGRIGNFIESSFKNIEEPKIEEDTKNNLNNKIAAKSEITYGKNNNIEEQQLKKYCAIFYHFSLFRHFTLAEKNFN